MPGPFPGMDPYLEDPALWPGLHHRLISQMSEALNALLPPQYMADINERLYVVQPSRSIYPDVAVLERPPSGSVRPVGGRSTAVVEDEPPVILTIEPVEIREAYIEILPVKEQERVVTVIEVLSHANKVANSPGRQLYVTKQREVLASRTHLLEIDLLRHGEPTVAPPPDRLLELGRWDYLISLHRGSSRWQFELWPVRVPQRLPHIRVPLDRGEPDMILDLQAAFDHSYDAGPYRRRVDYSTAPWFPLSGEDAAWADALLRERGMRAAEQS